MLKTLKNFFAFCGADNRRLFMASIWLGVVSAICSAMRIPAAAIVIQALLEKNVTMATLWISLGIIVVSLIGTIAINMKATMLQTIGGYRACANKRIEIAEHLRYLPMGWFNDNSLGEVTSVTTNTMENMANVATRVVMVTTRGFLTSGIIAVMMFLFDWRMGLITLAGLCRQCGNAAGGAGPFPAEVQCRRAACVQGAGICAGYRRGQELRPDP